MLTLDPTRTVGDLVRERPARSRIFEKLHIDFCCGGKVPLAQACAMKGLETRDVLQMLIDAELARSSDNQPDPDTMGLTELADHIEQTHHAYLRQELPRLNAMAHKVAKVHGDKDPRLDTIWRVFVAFRDELEAHMLKEEHILFPMVRQIDQAQGPVAFPCGSLANPIAVMEHEHENAGDALARFRALSDDYTPPHEACNTYRALFAALAELEEDMHQHVHKENNILFPKAMDLEARLKRASA